MKRIRSLDCIGMIAGPNLQYYDAEFYTDYMTFCKNNDCLPDIVTWHEIRDTFYSDWDAHYCHYRSIEASLGISAKEIVINEYARDKGDLGVPGQLVQFISKFEKYKVDGCLAYWTTAGCLNDLVTLNNKATGGWWLYKWYGEMTGNTVTVTPPDWNVDGLQGVATFDSTKKQARVIFGGDEGTTEVVVKGFDFASCFGSTVHAEVWEISSTGQNPSNGPEFKLEGDYPINNGQTRVKVEGMLKTSAYLMIITVKKDISSPNRCQSV